MLQSSAQTSAAGIGLRFVASPQRELIKMNHKIPTQIPALTLRFAQEADVPLILSFIKKLAEYEKLSHEVVTDEATLRQSLFGERRVAEVIIGDYNDEPVAFALFFHNFSTFLGRPGIYLEDLYVNPAMRGQGIGQMMLTYLAKLAVERGCGRLEWWVLDWNEPAINFYKKLGAQPMDEWTVYRLTGATLAQLAQEF
jgi:GNAT superfamily N-acetyltransferase